MINFVPPHVYIYSCAPCRIWDENKPVDFKLTYLINKNIPVIAKLNFIASMIYIAKPPYGGYHH